MGGKGKREKGKVVVIVCVRGSDGIRTVEDGMRKRDKGLRESRERKGEGGR